MACGEVFFTSCNRAPTSAADVGRRLKQVSEEALSRLFFTSNR